MREVGYKTQDRMKYLREAGYVVTEKWECEFRKEMKGNAELKSLYRKCMHINHLNPRDALYGGRTCSIKLYKRVEEGQKMVYVDFNSLYPDVNFRCEYPVGHPTVYNKGEIPNRVNGLLKCKVLPPRRLFLPILPYRCRGKLLFPLCRTCAETCTQTQCPHADEEERALTGTWVTLEIDKALSLGYVVLEKYEAWDFEEFTKYDPASGDGGLLSGYIKTFVALKQEASGYPDGVVTDEDKDRYVADYEAAEGIKLDKTKIERNNALRTLCKQCSNCVWGKLSEGGGKTEWTYVTKPAEFIKMMTDDSIRIADITYVSDNTVAVHWTRVEEFEEGLPTTNVVISAYTTAHARLKLYSEMERIGGRCYYHDTDSIIYRHDDSQYNPTLSPYLGGLKDETDGVAILEYVSGGPKNYAIRLSTGESVCKIRGFTLSHRNAKLLNFDSMKRIVLGGFKESVTATNGCTFVRDGQGSVFTRETSKSYALNFDKRLIAPDGVSTYPFGWTGEFDEIT